MQIDLDNWTHLANTVAVKIFKKKDADYCNYDVFEIVFLRKNTEGDLSFICLQIDRPDKTETIESLYNAAKDRAIWKFFKSNEFYRIERNDSFEGNELFYWYEELNELLGEKNNDAS